MPWLTPDSHAKQVEAAREIVLRRLDRCPAPRAALAGLLDGDRPVERTEEGS